jgi:hypothetical protein
MNDSINIEKISELVPIRLKIARMARGYKNRSTFALSAGAAITTYRAHERGDYEMKASDVVRYTETLAISIPWLLTGRGHPLDHQPTPNSEDLAIFLYYIRLEGSKADLKEAAEKEAALLLKKERD